MLLTGVASAQARSPAFCSTQLAQTVENIFTVLQLAGPLLGGVLALGATVALPVVSRVDLKKELKETRNNALLYGVIVAPLSTSILAFIMNYIVAGGASCGF